MKNTEVNTSSQLSKWQKLLIVLYKITNGTSKKVKYEDIVVSAFKQFPDTFHLPGYKEYPDSGDLVHKPLYSMKKQGLLTASQKVFALTYKGLDVAKSLSDIPTDNSNYSKPSRDVKHEIERILNTDSMIFFQNGQNEKILDTDFFQYMGVGVYATKSEFNSRLKLLEYILSESANYYPEKIQHTLILFHRFMIDKFNQIINEMNNKKERNI